MAYKFQFGDSVLGGKVTATGLDAANADIDNVGDIEVDSISSADNDIKLIARNGRDEAFQISASSGVYLFVDTNAENLHALKGLALDPDAAVKMDQSGGRIRLFASGNAQQRLEIGDLQIDAFAPLRMSGSTRFELGDNNHTLEKNGATIEVRAAGGKRLTIKNGGIDVEGELHSDTLNIADPTSLAGAGLARNGTTVDVGNGNGITVNANDVAVTPDQTTITSVKNDSLVVGRANGNDEIDFGTGGSVIIKTDGQARLTVTDADTTIAGNLIVNGTTTTVNSTTIEITGAFAFDGTTPGGNKTTLGVVNPTANRTVNIADSAGTLVPFAAAPSAATQITATPANLNLMAAGAGSSATVEGGDGIIIFDAGSSNAPAKVTIQDIVDLAAGSGRIRPGGSTIVNSNVTISNEITLVDTGAARTLTMPDITDDTVGKVFVIKDAKGTGASANNITLQDSAAGHQIDGQASITLESDRVAISLVACKDGSTFFYSIF